MSGQVQWYSGIFTYKNVPISTVFTVREKSELNNSSNSRGLAEPGCQRDRGSRAVNLQHSFLASVCASGTQHVLERFRGPPDLSALCPACSPSLPPVIHCTGGSLFLGPDFLPHSTLPFCQVRHLYDSGEARDIHLELEGLAHPRATPKLARHGESQSGPLGRDCPEQSDRLLSSRARWCVRAHLEVYGGFFIVLTGEGGCS